MQNKEIEEAIKFAINENKRKQKIVNEAKRDNRFEAFYQDLQKKIDNEEIILQYIDQLENKVKELEKENHNWEKYNLEKEEEITQLNNKLFEAKTKANKYDSLAEKIKDKINKEESSPVIVGGRRNGKTLNYGIKLGRKQALQELLEEK